MEDTDMTTAVTKITLSASRNIPFNKLVLSQSNVRRIKAGISIEALAETDPRRQARRFGGFECKNRCSPATLRPFAEPEYYQRVAIRQTFVSS
jgi:hypothetical protein